MMELENIRKIFEEEFANIADKKFVSQIPKWMLYMTLPPSHTIVRVNTLKTTVSDLLGCLQDYLKEQYKDKSCVVPSVQLHPVLNDVIIIKSTGLQDKFSPIEKEVIVDLQCGSSVLRGADIYAPGIIGAFNSMKVGDMVAVYADVEGLCRKGQTKLYTGKKIFLGNGKACVSRMELFKGSVMMRGLGIKMVEPIFDCPALGDFSPKSIFLQNLPSILCGYVLEPQPGETILDMCAAPGGKTTHIATLMRNEGLVIALDKSANKVSKIKENAVKQGLTCIQSYAFDATKAVSKEYIADELKKPPYQPNSFDKILLDAPCSCLGQRPLFNDKITAADVSSFKDLQRMLLKTGITLLKKDGILVYSTCTLTISENEENVAWVLHTFPSLSLEPQTPYIGSPGYKCTSSNLSEDHLKLLQRFDWMFHLDSQISSFDTDTIGFFIAKFKKTS